jgi:acyl-CoA:6-aminopenicillanic acid acyl transferase
MAVIEHPGPWLDACTIGGATGSATRDGAPIIFSNSDDPFTTRTRLVVVEPADGYTFIATQIVSPPPPVSFNQMHTRGLNAAGLAYSWASVAPISEPTSDQAIGIPYYQFGRLVLSQARTVADVIAILDRYPRAYHGNFLFADAEGTVALIEISTRTFHVETQITDGAFARTNHWISPRMTAIGGDQVRQASHERYERASALIAAQSGSIDRESLARIASDHHGLDTSGISICAHGNAPGPRHHRGGTVSSEIAEPRKGRFWYCYGWPCGSAPDDPDLQVYQDRSWGVYLPFDLAALEPGEYVTIDGRLTARAIAYLAATRTAEFAGARASI